MFPSVDRLSLPRLRIGGRADLGLPGRSPGEFVLVDPHLYQWMNDHWEGIAAWSPGGHADDPLAAYQSAGRQGGYVSGGGGGTPAPRGPGDPSISAPLVVNHPDINRTDFFAGAGALGVANFGVDLVSWTPGAAPWTGIVGTRWQAELTGAGHWIAAVSDGELRMQYTTAAGTFDVLLDNLIAGVDLFGHLSYTDFASTNTFDDTTSIDKVYFRAGVGGTVTVTGAEFFNISMYQPLLQP